MNKLSCSCKECQYLGSIEQDISINDKWLYDYPVKTCTFDGRCSLSKIKPESEIQWVIDSKKKLYYKTLFNIRKNNISQFEFYIDSDALIAGNVFKKRISDSQVLFLRLKDDLEDDYWIEENQCDNFKDKAKYYFLPKGVLLAQITMNPELYFKI